MPDETVLDGEVVAFDPSGRPSFNTLQNLGSSGAPLFYYAFDLLVVSGRDIMREPLEARRKVLEAKVLSKLADPIRQSPVLNGSISALAESVRKQSLEGLIAKRKDSIYEPGQRSGAWRKMRVNQGQEFVIGGYTPSPKNFDALIFGYYEGDHLLHAARSRNGFTPRSRELIFERLRKLEIPNCPFVNLPEARSGRWGQGLIAAKMTECRWLLCRIRHRSHNVECWTMPHRSLQCCHYCAQGHCVRHDQTELRQRNRAGLLNGSKRRAIREDLSLVIESQPAMRAHSLNATRTKPPRSSAREVLSFGRAICNLVHRLDIHVDS